MPQPLSLTRLISRPKSAIVLVAAFALAGCAAIALVGGVRAPVVHDEFSYLLAADTFAAGRLTNPTHRHWVHFETFHVIHQPSYASKFPPGQGLALALGQALTGLPIVGVWLTSAAMCAAICWMLLAWFPVRWAFLGGILAVFQFSIAGGWSQHYWGGAVAGLGGALLFGALARLAFKPLAPPKTRAAYAAVLGLGLVILAISRPFEGLIASVPAAALLLLHLLGKRSPRLGVRVVLPVVLVLAAGGAWLGYYNARVTGDPLRLPYSVHSETYMAAPVFVFEEPRPAPTFAHAELERFHTDWEVREAERWREGWLSLLVERLIGSWRFYLGFAWTLALLALSVGGRRPWTLFAATVCGAVFLLPHLVCLFAGTFSHYSAPVTGLVVALVVQGLRVIHAQRKARWLSRAVVPLVLLATAIGLGQRVQGHAQRNESFNQQRAELNRSFEEDADRHLVIVRYREGHDDHKEWVANRADINAAAAVWARSLGPARDQALIDDFADRRVWYLDVFGDQVTLRERGK